MAKHSPRFLNLVEDIKPHIRELTVDDVKAKLDRGERFHLVDVREESEWAKGHLPRAQHLGKGIMSATSRRRSPTPAPRSSSTAAAAFAPRWRRTTSARWATPTSCPWMGVGADGTRSAIRPKAPRNLVKWRGVVTLVTMQQAPRAQSVAPCIPP